MAVTEYTSSPSGSGKSYRRCAHFLTHEWLNDPNKGTVFTNFPIHIDEMVDYLVEKNPRLVAADLRRRIHIIPDEILKEWKFEKSGPWDYFEHKDIDGCRIMVDEIHNFVYKDCSKDWAKNWIVWLGEIRHRGCEFEGITQNEDKVHKSIKLEAGLKRTLFNTESRRDPFFGVVMHDWYELRASFITGRYSASVFEFEFLPLNGKWRQTHQTKFVLEPELFPLYDSYSAPIAGGTKSKGVVRQFTFRSKLGMLWWFFSRNWMIVLPRFLVAAFFFWVCFCGGISSLFGGFQHLQASIYRASSKPAASTVSAPSAVPAVVSSAPGGGPVAALSSAASVGPFGPVGPAGAVFAHPVDVVPLADLEALKTKNSDLQGKFDTLTIDLGKERARADDLEKKLAAFSQVVLIGPDFVSLRGGQTYSVGEVIQSGPYAGKRINEINSRKRFVRLDGGDILSLVR